MKPILVIATSRPMDKEYIDNIMEKVKNEYGCSCIIHGGAQYDNVKLLYGKKQRLRIKQIERLLK